MPDEEKTGINPSELTDEQLEEQVMAGLREESAEKDPDRTAVDPVSKKKQRIYKEYAERKNIG